MENMSFEVLDAIRDCFNDNTDESNELIATICHYLYHTTTDDRMKQGCVEIMNDLQYCIQCGSKMAYYEWSEPHTELDVTEYEIMGTWDCPRCGDGEHGR